MSDYQKELEFAKDLAKQAGKIMLNNFRLSMEREWKTDNTPLTITDTTINKLVIAEVKKHFPDDGVIGEENSEYSNQSRAWVVDPVDGTLPFSSGIPISMFSIALVVEGKTKIAVAYDPFLTRIFWAVEKGGAFVNDQKLQVSNQSELTRGILSVIGTVGRDKYDPGKTNKILAAQKAKSINLFSFAYSTVLVATGGFVGSIFGYGSPWDPAAVSLIVAEAGGKVTDLFGKVRRYDQWGDGFVASNEKVHDQLLEIIQQSKP
jgi:myo-inositol-1(or 4)-monophosphatase